MRRYFFLLALIGVSVLQADHLEVIRAEHELERMRILVANGAAPRARLEDAEYGLLDAQDQAVLDETLFGHLQANELTEAQAQEMVAAAQRRIEREQERLERQQKLVEMGVIAKGDLTPREEELNVRKQTLALAQSRVALLKELAAMVKVERFVPTGPGGFSRSGNQVMMRFVGSGSFNESRQLAGIDAAFFRTFGHSLPISANGETALHRSLGFDHRGRVDVALSPDQKEGVWLRHYLEASNIPYYAFRAAMAGKATGAHIHIGPPSTRLIASN